MTRATRRGPWIPEEDATLMQLVQSQGPNNWVRISQHMHYRSPKQCRERFHQNLKPTLNHEPITADEGELIEQMVAEMGRRWAEIARRLGNRSDNAVKNWWNGSMNRRRRNVIQSTSKTLSNRLEPLSAGRSLRPIEGVEHHRHHSYSRSWSSSHSAMSRSVYQSSHMSPSYRNDGSLAYPPSASRQDSTLTINARREQQLPALGLSRVSIPPFTTSTSLSSHSASGLSPRLPNPFSSSGRTGPTPLLPLPHRHIEPAMISPVGSEFSVPASVDRAPSLVSDHNSNSSVSPKTMHSPQPDLPAGFDARSQSLRRGSTQSLQASSPPYHGDEGYVSAMPQSASAEGKPFGSQIPFIRPDEPRPSHPTSRWSPGHRSSYSASSLSLPPLLESPVAQKEPKSARDTRMTFSSLLN